MSRIFLKSLILTIFLPAVLSFGQQPIESGISPTNMSGPVTRQIADAEENNSFRRSLVKAMRNRVRSGDMTRRDALKLRVALVSPAFRKHAEELAVTQIVFSGVESDLIQFSEDGKIQKAAIDWDGLITFLERLLPLLLQLLDIFG